MSSTLLEYLGNQAQMKVIHAFLASDKPRYLRELVSVCLLSPGGVSDILKRLKSLDLLTESKQANRKYYELNFSDEEREVLQKLF